MLVYVYAYFAFSFVVSLLIVLSIADFRRMSASKFVALWLTLPIYIGIEIGKGIKDLFREGI